MTIQALPPAPSRANDTPQQFSDKADAFAAALIVFGQEANADVAGIINTASVPLWVATTTYSRGNSVYSPSTYLTYRLQVATLAGNAANADPANDPTNWKQVTGTGNVNTDGTQTITGAKTFNNASNSFSGSGAGLTALNASNLASGTVPSARLANAVDTAAIQPLAVTTAKLADASVTPAKMSNPLAIGQSATLSGTSVSLAVPSQALNFKLLINNLSTNGTARVFVRLVVAAGAITTGYNTTTSASTGTGVTAQTFTVAFSLNTGANAAVNTFFGILDFATSGANTWFMFGNVALPNVASVQVSGQVSTGAQVTAVQLTTENGTDVFDSGTVAILYE